MNLKTAGIVSGIFFVLISASYIKGCNDGDDKGYSRASQEWEAKYNRLLVAPAKIDTVRIDTVFVPRKGQQGTSTAILDSLEADLDSLKVSLAQLAATKSTQFYLEGTGIVEVKHYPLKPLEQQFDWAVIEPVPEKIVRVETVRTKTVVEYVEVSIFEQAEFYIGLSVFGVIGYALAGGF